jgi:hypothetical protein
VEEEHYGFETTGDDVTGTCIREVSYIFLHTPNILPRQVPGTINLHETVKLTGKNMSKRLGLGVDNAF